MTLRSLVRSTIESRRRGSLALIAAFCVSLVACDNESPVGQQEEAAGEITVLIPLSKAVQSQIARAEVVISASDMTTVSQNLQVSGNTLAGTVRSIPAGSGRVFTINAYDSGDNLTYTGSATATVIAGGQVTVSITVRSVAASGTPQLTISSVVSAERGGGRTTITGEIANTGTAAATGVVIAFRARNSSNAPISDATASVGTVGANESELFTAQFSNTDQYSGSRYVRQADYTISYNEGADITGTLMVR